MQVNMHEAKSKLSALAEKAWEGETIVIAKAGKPYLDLVPHKEGRQRTPGVRHIYGEQIKLPHDAPRSLPNDYSADYSEEK